MSESVKTTLSYMILVLIIFALAAGISGDLKYPDTSLSLTWLAGLDLCGIVSIAIYLFTDSSPSFHSVDEEAKEARKLLDSFTSPLE